VEYSVVPNVIPNDTKRKSSGVNRMRQMKHKHVTKWLMAVAIVVGMAAANLCGFVQAADADDFRVAMLLPGSVNDYGYNEMGKRALDKMRARLGIETAYTEHVPVPNQLDVYREYASQGYDLVIGWGGQFTDGAIQAADEFPDIKFLIVNGGNSNGKNLGSVDPNVQDWAYVGGYLMARLSKTKKIGFVGGMCFPATVRNLDGYEQGAKKADPDAEVIYTWTGSFEDPIKAKQAAESMIQQGCDVLSGNLNNAWFGIFRAAKENGSIPVVTEWIDNSYLAPEVIVSSVLKDQAEFVFQAAEMTMNGNFPAKFWEPKLTADWGPAISKTQHIPDDIYRDAMKIQKKIEAGKIEVTQGDCR